MPWWIDVLSDAAVGHVKLGDGGGGRSTARREPFKGDDEPPSGDPALLRRFLAAGGVNARASELLDAVRNSIVGWTRHLGETRGIVFVRPGFIGPLLPGHVRLANSTPAVLAFLAENVGAIACDEGAGECLAELEDHVRAIEKVINRPLAMRYLGPCRTFDERTRQSCGTQLQCREDVLEVTCPKCRHVYNANHLQSLTENDLERQKMTVEQILGYMRRLPEEFRIKERTLREWRQKGFLKVHGYQRPNGRVVINRHSDDDEPLYMWSDVKKLRAERPARKVKAG